MRFVLLAILTVATTVNAQQPAPVQDFSRWQLLDRGATLVPYLNRPSLFLQNGVALAPDIELADGTIEFDVAVHGHAGFAGVVFRAESGDDYELVYLRTHRSRQWDALQYSPVFHQNEGWQLYTGKGYNGVAEIPANRWVHVRLVIEGRSAQVFVDNASDAQLVVTDLKRPWSRGRVGLWGRSGAANFSNFRATPVTRPAPTTPSVTYADGVIARWSISPAFPAKSVPADRLPDGLSFERVEADESGILNIGRYRSLSGDATSVVYARATLQVAGTKRVKLSFGYSDDVTIFLDGVPLFDGRARYLLRDGSFLGTLTLDDAVYLGLSPGGHQLVFAVGEAFGGWGVSAKFESIAGITVE